MKSILVILTTMLLAWALPASAADTYAKHSVLASGTWAKIRVPETGIVRINNDIIRRAGFTDLAKVKVYGYGGALVPEKLTQEWIAAHDDLQEVPTMTLGNSKYFYAVGPVSWSSKTVLTRTRNPYSNYGYYFITQNDKPSQTCTEEDLLNKVKESNDIYHFLREEDKFAWHEIGRNLVDGTPIEKGKSKTYDVLVPKGNTNATLQIVITAGSQASYSVKCGDQQTSGNMSFGEYDKAQASTRTLNLQSLDTVSVFDNKGNCIVPLTVTNTGDNPLRLDYISASFATPLPMTVINESDIPLAQYVHRITNQDHHADKPVDLVIIIPTSQHMLGAAKRLADFHAQHDNMSVRIVPADELYNEFSSGTPDVSAYKRYMKMYYDKAMEKYPETEATEIPKEMPKNVLLFGDCVWDNRMITLPSNYSVDNYLLGFQTENSYSLLSSIVCDDFITVMQDGKTIHVDDNENRDRDVRFGIGVGRLPVSTAGEAENAVEKIINYASGSLAGKWQNDIMFIGDDGDDNSHMANINSVADAVIGQSPGYNVKKVMVDAFERVSTSVGDRYPEVERMIRKQQEDGALVMNYGGHASQVIIATERLLHLSDFQKFSGGNPSLWFTAACETVPFDGTQETIGESAFLNRNGGAIAFYGTARTVLESRNAQIDRAFMRHLLSYDDDGKPLTLGEVQRRAKNDLVKGGTLAGTDYTINKHNYVLIGDPAMCIAVPQYVAVVDSINGVKCSQAVAEAKALNVLNVYGHIEDRKGELMKNFNGSANVLVKDSKVEMFCRDNEESGKAMKFVDRPTSLYNGNCSVEEGMFSFSFRVPQEINNDGNNGLITVYAYDQTNNKSANGECDKFRIKGWEEVSNDEVGPTIYCYLNNQSFINGGTVGRTPFFVAEISDKDGINATGSSLGHNMELVIDDDPSLTYNVTSNFVYDYGSSISGQTYYVLPQLEPGNHTLRFRAWDLLDNPNSVTLNFNVMKAMEPVITDIRVSPNPVKGTTTFYVTHDMQGSDARVRVEIFDMCGKIVESIDWDTTFSATSSTSAYRWTPSGIAPGIYLYRVNLSADGSEYVSKSKKLIIAQ